MYSQFSILIWSEWGRLSCIGGELLFYIHMGYASLYEFNIEYEVQKGMVKRHQVYDNRKSFIPYGGDYDGTDKIIFL